VSRPFTFRILHPAAAVLLLLAWLAVSNHCALAVLAGSATQAAEVQHACCPGAGGERPPAEAGKVCCKSLRALPPDTAAPLSVTPALLAAFLPLEILEAPLERALAPAGGASPPGAQSFAELVLQQSLLGHAPPIAA
jgi:hypothetical protein